MLAESVTFTLLQLETLRAILTVGILTTFVLFVVLNWPEPKPKPRVDFCPLHRRPITECDHDAR